MTVEGNTIRNAEQARERIANVYADAEVTDSGGYLTTVNELTDQLPALSPETLSAATALVREKLSADVDKIAVEEDKGMPIGVALAREESLPLAVARWYTYEIGELDHLRTTVDIDSEYFSGRLYLNGVESGDTVTIVDDTISTGGTMVALIEAVRDAGATVEEAHCVVEKSENGGVERVADETGVEVTTAVEIEVDTDGVTVVG